MGCLLAAEPGASGRTLFLLAGTCFLNDTSQTFPASLYTVSAQHTLRLFRTVVSGSEGATQILDDTQGKIYITFPSDLGAHGPAPTKVSIIHEDRPWEADVVTFNPRAMRGLHGATATATVPDAGSFALYPLFPEPPPWVSGHAAFMRFIRSSETVLVAVAGNPPAKGPRTTQNDWGLYSHLTFYGSPGGPGAFPINPQASIGNGNLAMCLGGKMILVDQSPPSLASAASGQEVRIVAANGRFVVTWLFRTSDLSARATFYVHDRRLERWGEIKFSASLPESRIFGSWLATTAMSYEGTGGGVWNDPNPGHNDESDHWVKDLLPDVRLEFEDMRLGDTIPGVLMMDNLADGRRITLRTNEEDSEMLDVRSGVMLYRVNDEIFSTQIEGDKLGPSTLVVKGSDVPQVHWVFWSKASPNLPSPAKPSTSH